MSGVNINVAGCNVDNHPGCGGQNSEWTQSPSIDCGCFFPGWLCDYCVHSRYTADAWLCLKDAYSGSSFRKMTWAPNNLNSTTCDPKYRTDSSIDHSLLMLRKCSESVEGDNTAPCINWILQKQLALSGQTHKANSVQAVSILDNLCVQKKLIACKPGSDKESWTGLEVVDVDWPNTSACDNPNGIQVDNPPGTQIVNDKPLYCTSYLNAKLAKYLENYEVVDFILDDDVMATWCQTNDHACDDVIEKQCLTKPELATDERCSCILSSISTPKNPYFYKMENRLYEGAYFLQQPICNLQVCQLKGYKTRAMAAKTCPPCFMYNIINVSGNAQVAYVDQSNKCNTERNKNPDDPDPDPDPDPGSDPIRFMIGGFEVDLSDPVHLAVFVAVIVCAIGLIALLIWFIVRRRRRRRRVNIE